MSEPAITSVSLVVPTHRRSGALQITLERLASLDPGPERLEAIVVDDGGDPETEGVVRGFASARLPIHYVAQPASGVARARNHGAQRATGELLIFLDDDILVEADHVHRHLSVRERYGDCLVNGHWTFAPELRQALKSTPFGRFRLEVEDWVKTGIDKVRLEDGRLRPEGITACNLGISAAQFRALGGFDETFPFAGCEDQDFSYRAARAGCTFVYDPEIRLLHNDHRSTLEQFGARQRRGARTFVHLVARHPEAFAGRPLLLENAPISRYDPPGLQLKKLAKRVYSLPPGLAFVRWLCRVLETHRPRTPLLRRLYEMTLGAEIFLGVRDGLATLPQGREAAVSAARRQRALAQANRRSRTTLHSDARSS